MSLQTDRAGARGCLGRRQLLIFGAATVTVLGTVGVARGQPAQLVMGSYARKPIGRLSAVALRTPIEFAYPNDEVTNFLVRLGERAGGGIGDDEDVVAFNTVCPHMGGPVGVEAYKPEYSVVGPCPLHLSTFDLTKHGMVVSGHAADSLPQIALELSGDEIHAVGVIGLVYGYSTNPVGA